MKALKIASFLIMLLTSIMCSAQWAAACWLRIVTIDWQSRGAWHPPVAYDNLPDARHGRTGSDICTERNGRADRMPPCKRARVQTKPSTESRHLHHDHHGIRSGKWRRHAEQCDTEGRWSAANHLELDWNLEHLQRHWIDGILRVQRRFGHSGIFSQCPDLDRGLFAGSYQHHAWRCPERL